MKLQDVILSVFKYKVNSLIIKYGKKDKIKKYTVDNSLIVRMDILENFDKEIFPFFTITIAVPSNIYRTITSTTYKNTLNAILHLQKAKFTDTMSIDTTNSPTVRDVLKDTYHCVIGATDVELSEQEQKMVEKSDNKYGQLSVLTLSLYKKSFYDNYQTVVNTNMQSGTLMEAMIYILNKAKLKKMLISPPDNAKSYKEYIIPPLQAHRLLARICDKYAFHKKGSVIYFGLDRGYVLDKVPKCTAYVKNEIKNTYVTVFTSSRGSVQTGGSYTNKEKKYDVVNASEVGADNATDVTKKTVGSNIISIDKDGKITKTNKKASKTTNVVVQNEGKSTPQAINRAIKESGKGIECQLYNEDISMIKPNKQFIVSAEGSSYKKYNGKYRLIKAVHSFKKEGDYFSLFSMIRLAGK